VLDGLVKRKALKLKKAYVTSAKEGDDMKPYPVNNNGSTPNTNNHVLLPARSITTFIFAP
jgi:hypothetical protein